MDTEKKQVHSEVFRERVEVGVLKPAILYFYVRNKL